MCRCTVDGTAATAAVAARRVMSRANNVFELPNSPAYMSIRGVTVKSTRQDVSFAKLRISSETRNLGCDVIKRLVVSPWIITGYYIFFG